VRELRVTTVPTPVLPLLPVVVTAVVH